MERIIDKVVIIACCITAFFLMPFSTEVVVGLLCALVVSALYETPFIPAVLRTAFLIAYLAAALLFTPFILMTPLIAYDLFRSKRWPVRLCWLVPVAVSVRLADPLALLFVCLAGVLACCLSWRTARAEAERQEYQRLRDELQETALSLEAKNRDLQEKQDYEVRLATLTERGRIAREIHDNVGHLLTRSVLQIEALQVVHADDPQLKLELEAVGTTIHGAFNTVRDSVHDLHDDSLDLPTQLYKIAEGADGLETIVDYQASEVPPAVGYCFLAIIREAHANAAKHSDANKLKVSVVEYPAFWQMTAHDNGSKEPTNLDSLGAAQTGIGLKTMEERTRALGGVFRVDYDRGLRVLASVPKEPLV